MFFILFFLFSTFWAVISIGHTTFYFTLIRISFFRTSKLEINDKSTVSSVILFSMPDIPLINNYNEPLKFAITSFQTFFLADIIERLSLIQYNTIQYNTIQYATIQYNAIQYNTIQYNTIQYNTIRYNTIQCNTIQYNTIQHSTIHHSTIQYNTIQYIYIYIYIYIYMVSVI